jgi:uncharacterized protein
MANELQTYMSESEHLSSVSIAKQRVMRWGSAILIMLVAAFLTSWEMSAGVVYQKYFLKHINLEQADSIIFFLCYTIILFFIAPLIFARVLLREKQQALGLRAPDNIAKAWALFIIALPISLYCMHALAKTPAFQAYYGFSHHVTFIRFLMIQFTLLVIYYVPEEFFFRGFLFMLLFKRIGWHALWITEIFFALAHLYKPMMEITYAIPVGIILNLLTLWTRSIVPAYFFHCCLGICFNFFILFR